MGNDPLANPSRRTNCTGVIHDYILRVRCQRRDRASAIGRSGAPKFLGVHRQDCLPEDSEAQPSLRPTLRGLPNLGSTLFRLRTLGLWRCQDSHPIRSCRVSPGGGFASPPKKLELSPMTREDRPSFQVERFFTSLHPEFCPQ